MQEGSETCYSCERGKGNRARRILLNIDVFNSVQDYLLAHSVALAPSDTAGEPLLELPRQRREIFGMIAKTL